MCKFHFWNGFEVATETYMQPLNIYQWILQNFTEKGTDLMHLYVRGYLKSVTSGQICTNVIDFESLFVGYILFRMVHASVNCNSPFAWMQPIFLLHQNLDSRLWHFQNRLYSEILQ